MTRKSSFVLHHASTIRVGSDLPEIKSFKDLLRLRRRVEAISDPAKWDYGFEGIYFSLLGRIAEAQRLYHQSVRSFAEIRNTLSRAAELVNELTPLLDKCEKNSLISRRFLEDLNDPRSEIEQNFGMSPKDFAECIADDINVFLPQVIENFPVESCEYACRLLRIALRKQLESLDQDYRGYEYPNLPESDRIGLAVYELWRDSGRENVHFPGSESGAPARLYRHLCHIGDIPARNAVAVLRKFGKGNP